MRTWIHDDDDDGGRLEFPATCWVFAGLAASGGAARADERHGYNLDVAGAHVVEACKSTD